MKRIVNICVMAALLFVGSGCVKYHKVTHAETPQAKASERFDLISQKMIKSITAYEQFKTLAAFDALWLSGPVREVYSYLSTMRRGKNRLSQQALLRRQLEENKHWVSFYVLAEVHDKTNPLLSEKHPHWSVYLKTRLGERMPAESIKEVDLEPELKWLFKHRYSSYKTAYLVKFPARDKTGEYLATQKGEFTLVFQSPHHSVETRWGLADEWQPKPDVTKDYMKVDKRPEQPTKDTVLRDEDFYWC